MTQAQKTPTPQTQPKAPLSKEALQAVAGGLSAKQCAGAGGTWDAESKTCSI